MINLLTGARRIATRVAPATIAAAAAAFSLGAYSGHAATLSGRRAAHHTFTLALGKRAVTLNPDASARFGVSIRRRRLRALISFSVISRLPGGVAVGFSPRRTRGRHATLILRVSGSAVPGHYRVRLRARGGRVRRTAVLTVNVAKPKAATQSRTGQLPDFSLTGSTAAPLEPGSAQPIDVLITNPNDLPLNVTSLSVNVQSVSAPQATPALPCSTGDFAVAPYSGPALTVPASSSRTLSGLGVPGSQWPQVEIIDLQSNQDGCQGASVSLTYSAGARLG